MFSRPAARLIPVAFLAAMVAGLCVVSPIGAAMLSPAIALGIALWFGIVTGERAIRWVRRVMRRAKLRRPVATLASAGEPRRTSVAGVPLAYALAMRPPPLPLRSV